MKTLLALVAMAGCTSYTAKVTSSIQDNEIIELGQAVTFMAVASKCTHTPDFSLDGALELSIEPSSTTKHHQTSGDERCRAVDAHVAIKCTAPCHIDGGRVEPLRPGIIEIEVAAKPHWYSTKYGQDRYRYLVVERRS